MSENTLRNKLSKVYAKVGKVLGRQFSVYRPIKLDDSLSSDNFIRKQYAAFTLSSSFTSPQNESFSSYITYTEHLDIIPGDIFYSDTETFVIVWNRGIEDVVAIKANDLVEIYRPTWETTGGLTPTRVRIARKIPISLSGISSATAVSLTQVQPTGQAKRWDVRIWAKETDVLQTDNIKLSNGTLLHVDSVQITELCQVLTCTEV